MAGWKLAGYFPVPLYHKRWRAHRSWNQTAHQKGNQYANKLASIILNSNGKNDEEIIFKAVEIDSGALEFASDELKNNNIEAKIEIIFVLVTISKI